MSTHRFWRSAGFDRNFAGREPYPVGSLSADSAVLAKLRLRSLCNSFKNQRILTAEITASAERMRLYLASGAFLIQRPPPAVFAGRGRCFLIRLFSIQNVNAAEDSLHHIQLGRIDNDIIR